MKSITQSTCYFLQDVLLFLVSFGSISLIFTILYFLIQTVHPPSYHYTKASTHTQNHSLSNISSFVVESDIAPVCPYEERNTQPLCRSEVCLQMPGRQTCTHGHVLMLCPFPPQLLTPCLVIEKRFFFLFPLLPKTITTAAQINSQSKRVAINRPAQLQTVAE